MVVGVDEPGQDRGSAQVDRPADPPNVATSVGRRADPRDAVADDGDGVVGWPRRPHRGDRRVRQEQVHAAGGTARNDTG